MILSQFTKEELAAFITEKVVEVFSSFTTELVENPTKKEQEHLTRKQAAALLNVCENTITNIVRNPAIPINKYKISSRRVVYKRSEIENYIQTQKIEKDGNS